MTVYLAKCVLGPWYRNGTSLWAEPLTSLYARYTADSSASENFTYKSCVSPRARSGGLAGDIVPKQHGASPATVTGAFQLGSQPFLR